MEYQRAKSLLSETAVVGAKYNGSGVWLKSLHEDQTAEVEFAAFAEPAKRVPIQNLQEL